MSLNDWSFGEPSCVSWKAQLASLASKTSDWLMGA